MTMRLLRFLRLPVVAVLATVAFGPAKARADFLIFDSKDDFLAASVGAPLQFQGFESFLPAPGSVKFPGFTLSNTNLRSPSLNVFSSFSGDGAFSVSANLDQGTRVVFAFDEPVSAFGIFVYNKSSSLLRFGDDLGDAAFLPISGLTPSITFFGVINTDASFREASIAVESGALGSFYAFDALSFGTVASIPEPSSVSLLAIAGLALLGYGRYRCRRGPGHRSVRGM